MTTKYIYVSMTLDLAKLANDLRRKRTSLGLTQNEVGELLDVTGNWVSHIEQSDGGTDISMRLFLELCDFLDVLPQDYFCFEDRTSKNRNSDGRIFK